MKKHIGTVIVLAAAMILIPLLAGGGIDRVIEETLDGEPKFEVENTDVFRVLDKSTGEVSEVSAFDYICGTVAGEMPISFHTEALKAQAVAAYTYADRQRQAQRSKPSEDLKGADLTNDPSKNQAYLTASQLKERWGKNFEQNYQKLGEAVSAVLGERIFYDGEPILAAYHALSSGKTESSKNMWGGDLPYLVAVDSSGDAQASGYESSVSFTAQEFKDKVTSNFSDIQLDADPAKWIADIKKTDSGTVAELTVGAKKITGANLRYCMGLRSACFDVVYQSEKFIFTVHGYGHGVGLSQTGANYMAENGASYKDILKHYYSGVTIENKTGSQPKEGESSAA